MDRDQATVFLREFGAHIGIPELAFDDEGTALIVIDNGPIVTMGHSAHTGTLELMVCLDEVIVTLPVMREALSANFMAAGTSHIVFAVTGNTLVLQRSCSEVEAADGGFIAAVEALVRTADAWSERLIALGTPSASEAPHVPAGMMRA